jgi:hypothetical protein
VRKRLAGTVTLEELCRALGCDRRAVKQEEREAAAGFPKGLKAGQKSVYSEKALRHWLESYDLDPDELLTA